MPSNKSFTAHLQRSPFVMAPMAGITDSAYRLMAKKGGAKLCYTEMVSVSGIHFGSRGTLELLHCFGGMNPRLHHAVSNNLPHIPFMTEGPLAVQLFGSDPALFVEALPVLEREVGERLALIDINMACPVKKVKKIGAGAELLRNTVRARKIVRALKAATNLPVTAKIRLLDPSDSTSSAVERHPHAPEPEAFESSVSLTIEFARALEEEGLDAITLHGRTSAQFYHGISNLDAVDKVGQALSVPLVASGDMLSPRAGVEALSRRGISGVMFARGTLGNPWIFSDAEVMLARKEAGAAAGPRHFGHSRTEKLETFIEHVGLLMVTDGQLLRARTLFCHYIKDFPHACTWRNRIMQAKSAEDFIGVATAYKKALNADHIDAITNKYAYEHADKKGDNPDAGRADDRIDECPSSHTGEQDND